VVAEKREHPGYYSVVRPPGPEIPARRKRNNSWWSGVRWAVS